MHHGKLPHQIEQMRLLQIADDQIPQIIDQLGSTIGESVKVSSLTNGDASAVYKLAGDKAAVVVKFVKNKHVVMGEATALSRWAELGVPVPQVISHSWNDDFGLLVMEFIDLPLMSDVDLSPQTELVQLSELGRKLKLMHQIPVSGYGWITEVNGKEISCKIPQAAEYIAKSIDERLTVLLSDGVIDNITADGIEWAKQIMTDDPVSPVLIHDDLLPYNVLYDFESEKQVIFDPGARGASRYMDIGRSVTRLVSDSGEAAGLAFISGYFSDGKPDYDLLKAGVMLRTIMEMYNWYYKGKNLRVQQKQQFLSTLDSFLGKLSK